MAYVSLRGLRIGVNTYYYADNAQIRINNDLDGISVIKIVNGDVVKETKKWTDPKGAKHRSIFKPGIGFKEWAANKLIKKEEFNSKTVRCRVGISMYKKRLFGMNVTHFQKRSSSGSFLWEEVYWPDRKLMYRYKRGQKSGQFFRPNGKVWGSYEGQLDCNWLSTWCILERAQGSRRWDVSKLRALRQDGPMFMPLTSCSFKWFDKKGKIIWAGQYASNQKTGDWIENYAQRVYIRGVSVPKELADAKPEDVDVYRVIQERNAQTRAVLIEKIGMNRIIQELKGEILDEDKQNGYSLIAIRIAQEEDRAHLGDKIISLLKVKCPTTGAFYTLRVPPGIKDVVTARQWTFGVNIDDKFQLGEEPLEFSKET